ncbi:ROK family transcriptional regulator [Actinomycetospora termitidis]|uniref:ROK family transcriptional regulator n=1 Tax=Actinomycetospora termitidis TaxID=3053470 RepID=A0ABT7MED7_9PSEU|nr:ROK family transcriptional regulator [Actinomycetospora sp. Odt1-22]MDL5159022.1 ROK family transcriptional regulator [Actinomycetospora sp. Odt1-22]
MRALIAMGEWPSITSTKRLAAFNAARVLEALYATGPSSALDVAARTGLSRPATDKALHGLVKSELVQQYNAPRDTPGRPTAIYEFDRGRGAVVAVDIGPHTARARVDPLTGPALGQRHEVVHVRLGMTRSTPTPERLGLVDEVVTEALAAADTRREQVWAIVAATPGIIDDTGSITRCEVIDSWHADVLRTHLTTRFPQATIVVENDVNAAAVAEYVHGGAAGRDEVAVVHAGARVGMGLLRGGELYRGAHGQAGEFAHVQGTPWRKANDALLTAGTPVGPERLDHVAGALAVALRELVFAVDPELVVLAGPLARTGEGLLEAVRRHVPEGFPTLPDLALSPVGPADVLLGTAELARRRAMERILREVAERL